MQTQIVIQFWHVLIVTAGVMVSVVAAAFYLGRQAQTLRQISELTTQQAAAIKDLYNRKVDVQHCREIRELQGARE